MNFFACGSSTPPLPPSTFSFRSSEAMAEQKDKGKGVMKDSPPTRNMAWGCHLQTDNVKPRVLLAACGSRAAFGFTDLCRCFAEWADVKVVLNKTATRFINKSSLPTGVDVFTDEDEWSIWKRIGDPVLHLDLAWWAEVMVIAPLSADTLGKISMGLCDDLLTCLVRVWDSNTKRLFVAPDMNHVMRESTMTELHAMELDDLGISLIRPVERRSFDGDSGNGSMVDPSVIMTTVRMSLVNPPNPSRGSG